MHTIPDYFPFDHLIHEDAATYHAQRSHYLSSHALGDFRKCPRLFHDKHKGAMQSSDSRAYQLGRAIHCRVLEGQAAFAKQYSVGGPINERTGKTYGRDTQAFAKWAATQSGEFISDDEADLTQRITDAVAQHKLANTLLNEGMAEGVLRAEIAHVPCQIRCDWITPNRGLVDLKTCEDLDWFERDARKFNYIAQLAFYRMVIREVTGITVPVHLVAVEKQRPHRVGVWLLDEASLDLAEDDNRAAMELLKQCRRNEDWPTGYEGLRVLAS